MEPGCLLLRAEGPASLRCGLWPLRLPTVLAPNGAEVRLSQSQGRVSESHGSDLLKGIIKPEKSFDSGKRLAG